jgi:hypothetical protein
MVLALNGYEHFAGTKSAGEAYVVEIIGEFAATRKCGRIYFFANGCDEAASFAFNRMDKELPRIADIVPTRANNRLFDRFFPVH